MQISTGQGDCGRTTLVDQTRVWKDDLRVASGGDLDELSSWLGVIAVHLPLRYDTQREQIVRLQQALLTWGVVVQSKGGTALNEQVITSDQINAWTDIMDRQLAPATGFILPGGTPVTAFTHVARTVCRRTERNLTPLIRATTGEAAQTLQAVCACLNRLGNWLFVLTRYTSQESGVSDGHSANR